MKKFTTILFITGLVIYSKAQVGIDTTDPQATLDVVGMPTDTSKLDGVIAPRITGDQLALKTYTSDQTGALVYVTAAVGTGSTTQTTLVTEPGYYYFDGTLWNGNDWHTKGNIGTDPSTNYVGARDAGLMFKINNNFAGQLGVGYVSYGYQSLYFDELNNGTSSATVSIGRYTMQKSTGDGNTAIGDYALRYNSGTYNVAAGYEAGGNTTSSYNIALGYAVLAYNTGNYNIGMGNQIMYFNTGTGNIGIGNGINGPFASNKTGDYNIAIGSDAGVYLTTGDNNICIGNGACQDQYIGSNNIAIGYKAGTSGYYNNNQFSIQHLIYGINTGTSNARVGIGRYNPGERLHVEGAVKLAQTYNISATNATTPVPTGGAGTIAYSNNHLYVWNGTAWKQVDN